MGDNSKYFVEFAKSGRSKCQRCKEHIEKGEIRIGVDVQGEAFESTVSYHPSCFNLPRKLSSGAGKITAHDFVADYLEDRSEGEILPAKAEELAEAIESKPPKKGNNNRGSSGSAGEATSFISHLKRAYEEQDDDDDDDDDQDDKKKKKKHAAKKIKTEKLENPPSSEAVKLYAKYHKLKVDELKDILRWNRQVLTGTKEVVLTKVIDGGLHGRLARCALCGGRLKLLDDGLTVNCVGRFDEGTNVRIPCSYEASSSEAPRWHPWFTEEPSEEEKEKMDGLEAEATGEGGPANADGSGEPTMESLIQGAKELTDWKLSSRDGMRAAAAAMVDLLMKAHGGKHMDITEDASDAKLKVGQVIAAHKDKSAAEMIPIMVKEFGFREDKQQKAAKREANLESVIKNSKNAALVSAFQELSELYFKEGNSNAGAAYKKVVNALMGLSFEVNEENAMGLSKGKTKVANIGKSSAEKILEFCKNGTIEKLEEKKAALQ